MTHLWSGRFDENPDAHLFEFGASFKFDRRLFEDDVRGSIAWTAALRRSGVLSIEDAAAIERGLRTILQRGVDAAAGDEDVHTYVERALVALIGEPGRRLHTGRSRNEQVALDMRLYLKRRVPHIRRKIAGAAEELIDLASRVGDAVMPSYTHLRRAQPVLVAHFLLSHVAALRRDYDRLAVVLDEADDLPLGSGAIAGTNYNIDLTALAADLGFSRVARNSMDVSGDRDFVAVFLHASALGMVHLSRLAEDFILFTSEEFGFFELADAAATGSSLMPQKKNPDPLELVRGKTGRTIGHLAGWLATIKGLPAGYSKDLQEDKEALFDAEDTWLAALGAVGSVVATLTLSSDRSRDAAAGFPLATDVADYLVARGLPFRDAHEVVGAIVRRLLKEGKSFEQLSLDEWRMHSALFQPDIRDAITPRASVSGKRTPQSTNPGAVAAALADAKEWIAKSRI